MKLSALGSERVFGNKRSAMDIDVERPGGPGGPDAAMVNAKRAGAGASGDPRGFGLPHKLNFDVPTVTATGYEHGKCSVGGIFSD